MSILLGLMHSFYFENKAKPFHGYVHITKTSSSDFHMALFTFIQNKR